MQTGFESERKAWDLDKATIAADTARILAERDAVQAGEACARHSICVHPYAAITLTADD